MKVNYKRYAFKSVIVNVDVLAIVQKYCISSLSFKTNFSVIAFLSQRFGGGG